MLEKIFGDYIELALSLLVSALVILSISTFVNLSYQYQDKQLESQTVANEIKEQRNHLFYNNTKVYQQDIVSLIIRQKGDREIHVKLNNGNTYSWTKNRKSSEYKVSEVSSLLPKELIYESSLIYGANKYEVIGYQFVGRTGS